MTRRAPLNNCARLAVEVGLAHDLHQPTALACAIAVSALRLPLCRFTDEEITIDVWPREICVTGIYRYENVLPIPIQQGLHIPLSADAKHPEPFSVTLSERLVRVFGTYRCDLQLPAKSARILRLRYRQFAPAHNGRYLLTTTRLWRRPLRSGRYRIVAHGVTVTRSNYPLAFERTNFLPQRDWEFSWR